MTAQPDEPGAPQVEWLPHRRLGVWFGLPDLPDDWRISELHAYQARMSIDGEPAGQLTGHLRVTMYLNLSEGEIPDGQVCPVELVPGDDMPSVDTATLAQLLKLGRPVTLKWEAGSRAWSITVRAGERLWAVETDGGLFKVRPIAQV